MAEQPTTEFERQVLRLHELTVWGRWLFILGCWLVVLPLALWTLRAEFALWRSHFTVAALRYAIQYNLPAALAIGACVGLTLSTLLWQSANILWGFPPEYRKHLERRVTRIRTSGRRHPLWRWVMESGKD